MPGVTLADKFRYHTAGDAQRELGLSREEFNRRMKQGILPAPTYINEHNIRFFDDEWLKRAKAIVEREKERPLRPGSTET